MDFGKKRKIDKDCRVFNKDWMAKNFFSQVGKKEVSFLCSESVAILNEYKISGHYATKDLGYGSFFAAAGLQKTTAELNRKLENQHNVLQKVKIAQKAATHASFVIVYTISKDRKSFSEGEFVKKCILDVVDNF